MAPPGVCICRKLSTLLLSEVPRVVRATNPPIGFPRSDSCGTVRMEAVMTPSHFSNEHDHWTHVVDYETLWVLAFAAVVVGSGFFALTSIAQ